MEYQRHFKYFREFLEVLCSQATSASGPFSHGILDIGFRPSDLCPNLPHLIMNLRRLTCMDYVHVLPCLLASSGFGQWEGLEADQRAREERGQARFPPSIPRSPLAVTANTYLQLQPSSLQF